MVPRVRGLRRALHVKEEIQAARFTLGAVKRMDDCSHCLAASTPAVPLARPFTPFFDAAAPR